MKNKKHNSKGARFTVVGSILILMAGFLMVLMGLNVYQYFKIKPHFASEIMARLNRTEVNNIKGFFAQVSEKLLTVHDLGKNGVLKFEDIINLNRKFFPLLKNQKQVTGLILADSTGREYFLYLDGDSWVTRVSSVKGSVTHMVFQKWNGPDEPVKKWEKNVRDYDPRKRPWFRSSSSERRVFWSPVYRFYSTGKPGVTASVSWAESGNPPRTVVFALDITLSQIQKFLELQDDNKHELLFILNPRDKFFITPKYIGMIITAAPSVSETEAAEDSVLISRIFQAWEKAGMPLDSFVKVSMDSSKWLASLRPLEQGDEAFYVGIAAPERVVLADLRNTLFDVDFSDMAVALLGGAVVLFIFWKVGGFRSEKGQESVPPLLRIRDYIEQGEGSQVEFKSTVRTNLKTGKQGKEIEFAWLKAVVAFLNSNGGALLIGVDDDGRIVGIEPDNFENQDKCQLHLKNLINQHIGAEYSTYINISLVEIDERTVILIECTPCEEPVFMKIGKNEEFYIRSGPSSIKLSPSQTVTFVLQKIKAGG